MAVQYGENTSRIRLPRANALGARCALYVCASTIIDLLDPALGLSLKMCHALPHGL